MVYKECPKCGKEMIFYNRRLEGVLLKWEEPIYRIRYYQCNDCKIRGFRIRDMLRWVKFYG